MTLSPNERDLLLALKSGRHFKSNPIGPHRLLNIPAQDANPVGRRLLALGYAAKVHDSDKPAALLMRITDAGLSEADKILAAQRQPKLKERLTALPVAKSLWEVVKLGLAAVFGALVKTYIG